MPSWSTHAVQYVSSIGQLFWRVTVCVFPLATAAAIACGVPSALSSSSDRASSSAFLDPDAALS